MIFIIDPSTTFRRSGRLKPIDILGLTRRIAKQYVQDNLPELERHFEDIWKLSISRKKRDGKDAKSTRTPRGVHFLSDDLIIQTADLVIPFILGVLSSFVADAMYERIISDRKKSMLNLKAVSEKIRMKIDLDEKLCDKLLPLIFREVEKELRTRRRRKVT